LALLGLAGATVALSPRFARTPRAPASVTLALLGCAFWFFRERLYFLGDAKAMLGFYETERVGVTGHALLTTLVNYNLYRLLKRAAGLAPEDVVAATSVAAGIVFTVLAWRAARGREEMLGDPPLVRALLLTGGAMALFFGYVENYAFVVPAILVYLVAGADALAGRRGLGAPFLALLAAMGFHFVGFTMIPSFAFLAWHRGTRFRGALMTLALVAAALALGRGWGGAGFQPGSLGRHLLFLPGEAYYRAYAFLSAPHLIDVANALLLLLPLGAPLLVLSLARRRARRSLAEPAGAFLALAAGGALAFLLVFNAEIGVARDWDLFAFAAIPLALLAARLASRWARDDTEVAGGSGASDGTNETRDLGPAGSRPEPARPPAARTAAIAIAAAQLANTIPFVWVNHDAEAGLARARHLMEDTSRLSPHAQGYGAAFIGPALATRNRWQEALPYYETTARIRSEDAGTHLGLGGALIAVGRDDDAIVSLRRALELDPREWRAWSLSGSYHARRGRYAEAFDCYERGLAINPRDPKLLTDYGVALATIGRYDQARALLERAVSADRWSAEAQFNLARVYDATGRPDEARRIWETLLSHSQAGPAASVMIRKLDERRGAEPPP
jgi:superkiller protein 3